MNREESSSPSKIACPYPDCSGWVSARQKRCLKCRRALLPCPNCGQVMAEEIGVCRNCGFRLRGEQALVAPVESKGREAPSGGEMAAGQREREKRIVWRLEEIARLIADGYRQASLADVNMVKAADALQPLRIVMSTEQDIYNAWNAIDLQIGKADENALRKCLMDLREKFIRLTVANETGRLRSAFQQDAQAGWSSWLEAFAESLSNWRLLLAYALCDADLPFSGQNHAEVKRARKVAEKWHQGRAFEELPWLIELAGTASLSVETRSRLLVEIGRTYLDDLEMPEQAKAYIEQAEQLNGSPLDVLQGWGEYWLAQNDMEKARSYFEQATRQFPDVSIGYSWLGDICELQNDLPCAEAWYRKAIQFDIGNEQGYLRLVHLYSRPELFAEHQSQLAPLLELAGAVEPPSRYHHYLAIADAYYNNDQYEAGDAWIDRAIRLHKNWPKAYVNRGYTRLAQSEYEAAEKEFKRAVKIAPDSFDACWAMSLLFETTGDWEQALTWYQRCLDLRPEWKERIRASIIELYMNMEEYEQAEQELLESLRASPGDAGILNRIHQLTDLYITQLDDTDAARRVYDAILEIKGAGYEADYNNRLGNLLFYGYDFEGAAPYYRKAITLEKKPVFYYNLSLALQKLAAGEEHADLLDESIAAARKAVELEPDQPENSAQLENALLHRNILEQYGEIAFNLTPEESPLKMEITTNLSEYYLQEGERELSESFLEMVGKYRSNLYEKYHIDFPGLLVTELENSDPEMGSVSFLLQNTPVIGGPVRVNSRYFSGTLEQLQEHGIQGEPDTLDPEIAVGCWVHRSDWEKAQQAGLDLMEVMGYPLVFLEVFVQNHLYRLVTHQLVAAYLHETGLVPSNEQDQPLLTDFTLVLRSLVREKIPLPAGEVVVGRFLELWKPEANLVEIVEAIRSLPEVQPGLPGSEPDARLVSLSPEMEAELECAVQHAAGQPVLVLERKRCDDLVQAVASALINSGGTALVVTKPALRPLVKKLLEGELQDIPVISTADLPPGRVVDPVGRAEAAAQAQGAAAGGEHAR